MCRGHPQPPLPYTHLQRRAHIPAHEHTVLHTCAYTAPTPPHTCSAHTIPISRTPHSRTPHSHTPAYLHACTRRSHHPHCPSSSGTHRATPPRTHTQRPHHTPLSCTHARSAPNTSATHLCVCKLFVFIYSFFGFDKRLERSSLPVSSYKTIAITTNVHDFKLNLIFNQLLVVRIAGSQHSTIFMVGNHDVHR